MFANPILLLTLFTQILAKESNTGEQDQLITGWLNEPLHLDCLKKSIQNEEQFVARGLSEAGKGLKPFVSSKWDQRIRNYTKICNKDHSMYLFCLTQVSSYVTNDQVIHFDIESASADLNGRLTLCYDFFDRGPFQTIIIRVRASITKWPQSVRVVEGSTTTVECKATGRPTPTVIIQRENHSLCNSTGQCKYEIPAASKSKHEGEYYCLVQQRNSRQIKRSLNLTVIPARDMTDNRAVKYIAPLRTVAIVTLMVIPFATPIILYCLVQSYGL